MGTSSHAGRNSSSFMDSMGGKIVVHGVILMRRSLIEMGVIFIRRKD
jgi:hypothetical protein